MVHTDAVVADRSDLNEYVRACVRARIIVASSVSG